MERLDIITKGILDDYKQGRPIDKMNVSKQPNTEAVIDIALKLQRILLPGYYKDASYKMINVEHTMVTLIEDVMLRLSKQIGLALSFKLGYDDKSYEDIKAEADKLTLDFLEEIPTVREYLATDLEAFYEGDPAAYSKEEIVFAYPGFKAITIYRLAHILYKLDIPILPRIMSEYAHGETGIDIHPGATIGKYFFIDHGTGIVVGETSIIGEHVKIYQGVTIGALSTRGGQNLKNKKRHPTILDNVTIYSGASILGGDTIIGEGSVIGGNTFITESVDAGARVSAKAQEHVIKF